MWNFVYIILHVIYNICLQLIFKKTLYSYLLRKFMYMNIIGKSIWTSQGIWNRYKVIKIADIKVFIYLINLWACKCNSHRVRSSSSCRVVGNLCSKKDKLGSKDVLETLQLMVCNQESRYISNLSRSRAHWFQLDKFIS